jgi:ferredoxin-NADP reductase
VQVRVGESDKPAFIAIAAAVGTYASQLELLVKRSGSTAELLCALEAGAPLQLSDVQGRGFQLDALQPPSAFTDIFLFATGSGLSPVRALLETPCALGGLGLAGGGRRVGHLHLYVGVRSPEHLAFADRVTAWEAAGLTVTRVFSELPPKRYVQDAFLEAGGVRNAEATGAVLVGQKGMAEAITAALAGVPKERICTNF